MKKAVLGIVAAAAALTSYDQNNRLTVSEYEFSFSTLPESFDGLRIVQLSDLHNKRFGKKQARLLERVAALAPDMIAVTGDLIDRRRTTLQTALPAQELCIGAVWLAPVFYVPGNHEAKFQEYPAFREQLMQLGVQVLENRTMHLSKRGASITIAGIADPDFFRTQKTHFRTQLFGMIPVNAGFTMLLSHRPEKLNDYGAAGADLVLAGHAHGGQIRLPAAGPVWVPSQGLFPPLAQGARRFGKTTMVISRGLGNSLFPQRVFNCPEIVCVTLRRNRKETGDF
ncbi:MAG TPA: metallophosphoesterase [Candidatus Gallacutalibacter pullistercoris]|nr:metallophosphoesterase [Candidatus Gallacutalibacter pullistercoris]